MTGMELSSLEFVVDFFRRNGFVKAEAALVSELETRNILNGDVLKVSTGGSGFINEIGPENPKNGIYEAVKEQVVKDFEYGYWSTNVSGNGNDPSSRGEWDDTTTVRSERSHIVESSQLDEPCRCKAMIPEEKYALEPWPRSKSTTHFSDDFDAEDFTSVGVSRGDATSYHKGIVASGEEGKQKQMADSNDARFMTNDQINGDGRALYSQASQGVHVQPNISGGYELTLGSQNNGFPPPPPGRLKSEAKLITNWDEKFKHNEPTVKRTCCSSSLNNGSFLDIPLGQDIHTSGDKRTAGGSCLPISQGIANESFDLVSGIATMEGGLRELIDYPNVYWDSDEYDDNDDVGYIRQPVEDETWFLAHEIDYPSDCKDGTGGVSAPDEQRRGSFKKEEDAQTLAEEISYFPGEHFIEGRDRSQSVPVDILAGLCFTESNGDINENNLTGQCDKQFLIKENLNRLSSEPVWQEFVSRNNELIMLRDTGMEYDYMSSLEQRYPVKDQNGYPRSIGVGISSETVDIDRTLETRFLSFQNGQELEYKDVRLFRSKHSAQDSSEKKIANFISDTGTCGSKDQCTWPRVKGGVKFQTDAGVSFPSSVKDGQLDHSTSSFQSWGNDGYTIFSSQDPRLNDLKCNSNHFSSVSDLHGSDDHCTWPRVNDKGVKHQADPVFSFSLPVGDEQPDCSTSASQSWGNYSNTMSYQDGHLSDRKVSFDNSCIGSDIQRSKDHCTWPRE